MDDIFASIAGMTKEIFGHLVIVVLNVLAGMLLFWATDGNILALVLSLAFIPVATWAYYIVWRALPKMHEHGVEISQTQAMVITIGLGFAGVVEIILAAIEIIRLFVNVGEPPAWVPTVVLGVAIIAVVVHAVLFFVYIGAGPEFNSGLHRAFENDMKRAAEEKHTKQLRRDEIKQDKTAAEHALRLTSTVLEATLPIIAEEKAKAMADDMLRRLGLDNNPRLRAAVDHELITYRLNSATAATAHANATVGASDNNGVIDAQFTAKPAEPVAHTFPFDIASLSAEQRAYLAEQLKPADIDPANPTAPQSGRG